MLRRCPTSWAHSNRAAVACRRHQPFSRKAAIMHTHASRQPDNAASSSGKPILLFDVMDTLVHDPFFKEMPQFFGLTFQELLKAKHPTAWVQFECNQLDEAELCRIFFADGRDVDRAGLLQMLRSSYRYLDGMEPLLSRLYDAGYECHAVSNYPIWWKLIEDKLQLSRYLQWTFLSCTGPMQGVRKPDPEAYRRVISHLTLPPDQLLFIDDRPVNVQAAEAEGIPSVLFNGSVQLEVHLRSRGLEF